MKGEVIKGERIYIPNIDITIAAPYEADVQFAYLDRINFIDYVMTEDPDLLEYRSRRILYKFN